MRMTWISVGIVASALVAFTACGNSTATTSNSGGSGSGGNGSGGNGSGGQGTGGSGMSCHECACDAASQCVALCDSMTAGNLNFCTAGMTTGSQCGDCVKTNCGGVALADCN